jgi:hypothetical protein
MTLQQKKDFMVILQDILFNIDIDNTLVQELKGNPFYISLTKSAKMKQPQQLKNELKKLNDTEYERCEYCDKLIKLSYIEVHKENSITCYRQRQTKRNVYNVKELYNEKYGKYQALNLSLKDKHVEFKDLFLPVRILKVLEFETKYDLIRH